MPYLKHLSLSVFLLLSLSMQAQWVSIPDTNFGTWLNSNGYANCLQGNNNVGWQMDTMCNEVIIASNLKPQWFNIYSLEGIQYFDELLYLDCSGNNLINLPSLPDGLTVLQCHHNNLTAFVDLPASLQLLDCQTNNLDSLPELPNGITTIDCGYNNLAFLPVLPNTLNKLWCNNNQLTYLPLLPGSLTNLNCGNNQLTTLPALPASLTTLFCEANLIDSLPSLSDSLVILNCAQNLLSSLTVLPNMLQELNCSGNSLTALPNLPNSLARLQCTNNALTSLPDLPDSLGFLYCYDNMNLFCLPRLKKVRDLAIFNTGISCLPNQPQANVSCSPPLNNFPICDAFNQNNCNYYWNVSGKLFNELNSNCTIDLGESMLVNLELNLYESGALRENYCTGDSYIYTFNTDLSTYTYTVDTTNLPFTIACPDSGYYTSVITAQDSFDTDMNFGLRCKPGFDLEARGIATPTVFRPANFTTINISAGDASNFYGAHCAAGVSGAVTVNFSGPVQFISAAPNALTPTVSSNTLTYTIADFGAVNFFDDFNIILQTDTTAQMGQQVCFTVSVTPLAGDNNPANNTLTHCFPTVNSYDPNDKIAYPAGNTDTAQKELTYTIRFQNTGNAEAQHIYITDTLSQYIDESSFQLLGYSHQPMVQLKEKAIRFNFPNINLPDSFSNEPASHGYVQYKVRLKENLPIGTEIENTAFIYFDFNAPVITNTTVNTISVVSSIEAPRIADIGIRIYPNPTSSVFTMELSSELVNEVVTITDITGRMVHQSDIRNQKSEISITASGVYFVRIGSSVKRVVLR